MGLVPGRGSVAVQHIPASLISHRRCARKVGGRVPSDYCEGAFDRGTAMSVGFSARPQEKLDFELVFHKMPGLCLVLDIAFNIVAQNEEHGRVTEQQAVGHNPSAAFADNPDDPRAIGAAQMCPSLAKALKTRAPDALPSNRSCV